MAKLILIALFIGSAVAAPSGLHYGAAPALLTAPVVAGHAVQTTAVHHPAQINTHLAPASVAVQTPTLSGYSFTSEVRHDAPALIAAAPVVHAAAPLVAHAAPVVHHAAPLVSAPVVHSAPVVASAPILSKSYSVETGRLVAGHAVAAAPLVAHAAPVVAAHAAPILAHGAPLLSAWKKA